MARVEQDFDQAAVEIIWVLEQTATLQPGTAENCRDTMDGYGSEAGWCVGDSQTEPEPGAFDDSAFSRGRGFDMLVLRDSMEIVYSTSHGTTAGNENPTGDEVLAEVREILNAR